MSGHRSEEPRTPPKTLRLAVVVSHKNRGREYLEAAWSCLKPQFANLDEFIVSDQGSDKDVYEDVERFVMGIGATLVTSEPPEGSEWSQAQCRNAGGKVALELGAKLILFLDNDLLLRPDSIAGLASIIEGTHPRLGEGADVAIPVVIDGKRFLFASELPLEGRWPDMEGQTARPGSGCPMVRAEHFKEADGFDESFVGWGSEDIAFLSRLEKMGRTKVVSPEEVAYHQPHEENPWKESTGEENKARALEIIDGELEPINPDGWGEGRIAVLRGDKL